jgi:HEAT repeat protein
MYFLLVAVVLSSGPGREASRRAAPTGTPTGLQAQLTDAEVVEQAQALLGAIDTPISAAQWKALGPRAEPLLAALVDDDSELPTRRARAIDALVTVGGEQTRARFARVAEGDGQPFVVRLSALRGLGAIVPASELPVVLGALLTKAPDSRVRAAAGEVLALKGKGTACAAVEAQLQREGADGQAQFHRAAKTCGLHRP